MEFKSRYNNHTQSFRQISHINDMDLSKYLWTLKVNETDYHLKWNIKSHASQKNKKNQTDIKVFP